MENLPAALLAGTLGWIWLMTIMVSAMLGTAALVLWVWMLVEVLTRETDQDNMRLVWTLVIVFTHWLGAVLYVIIRRRDRIRKVGK